MEEADAVFEPAEADDADAADTDMDPMGENSSGADSDMNPEGEDSSEEAMVEAIAGLDMPGAPIEDLIAAAVELGLNDQDEFGLPDGDPDHPFGVGFGQAAQATSSSSSSSSDSD